jgi:hypothetical protein
VGGVAERKAVLTAAARKTGLGVVYCSEKFVFKDRCENTVNVARCYLVTSPLLVAELHEKRCLSEIPTGLGRELSLDHSRFR